MSVQTFCLKGIYDRNARDLECRVDDASTVAMNPDEERTDHRRGDDPDEGHVADVRIGRGGIEMPMAEMTSPAACPAGHRPRADQAEDRAFDGSAG